MSHASPSFACALALGWLLAGQRTATAGQENGSNAVLTAIVQPERGLCEWHFKGRKLLAYAFATNQFKPYVRELYPLRGDDVLRDAPTDHLHHHGLMYAIHVVLSVECGTVEQAERSLDHLQSLALCCQ